MKTLIKKISVLSLILLVIASLGSCKATQNANNKQRWNIQPNIHVHLVARNRLLKNTISVKKRQTTPDLVIGAGVTAIFKGAGTRTY